MPEGLNSGPFLRESETPLCVVKPNGEKTLGLQGK